MPNISEIKNSRFLSKGDLPKPVLVTIRSCEKLNVEGEGRPAKWKWCLHFDELEKPWPLGSISAEIIAKITGSENTDNWTGHKIVLFHDPNISMQGKLVGGVRPRAPKAAPAQPAQNPAPLHSGSRLPPVQPPLAPASAPAEEEEGEPEPY